MRIPKDHRCDCDKVTVERDGDKRALTPKRRDQQNASWADSCRKAPVLDVEIVISKDSPCSEFRAGHRAPMRLLLDSSVCLTVMRDHPNGARCVAGTWTRADTTISSIMLAELEFGTRLWVRPKQVRAAPDCLMET
ncbi:MAG: hypothetical protein C0434_03085 [Xanthomonadaceae bacterium]|nr:hypothetical protein [Xanthomonadaceae bacterium]